MFEMREKYECIHLCAEEFSTLYSKVKHVPIEQVIETSIQCQINSSFKHSILPILWKHVAFRKEENLLNSIPIHFVNVEIDPYYLIREMKRKID